MECLEYFLDLAPEAVESADPSTGELIIQKLHQISLVHSSDVTFHAFKLLIMAGLQACYLEVVSLLIERGSID